MFYHRTNEFLYPLRVACPDPKFASMLMEQLAGQNGELAAGMQYIIQGLKCKNAKIKDLLLDIGTEELNHMEMVAHMIELLVGEQTSTASPEEFAFQLLGGGGPLWINSMGSPFSSTYVDAVGDIAADLQSNIAAEFRAKAVYERLYRQAKDPAVQDFLKFLISREEAHANLFRQALDEVQGQGVLKDFVDTSYSRQYYDLSQPRQSYRLT
ncbi:manganese catalase family protein [Desulfofundulus thermosubterraneus]|uniref:Mn-containing catalase n=1 Tax=Desulfofundulus thermosubterraneus DSM 16057 TaxID=1121432 RepID=A0A1M6BU18_9FIRM|nr:manganese catalase family protein [Desulfofundulus thermosubterraneus]SHI52282.1 Mn-containing catalase [Desulfofundulus thermosubterraneus DSM 16057]